MSSAVWRAIGDLLLILGSASLVATVFAFMAEAFRVHASGYEGRLVEILSDFFSAVLQYLLYAGIALTVLGGFLKHRPRFSGRLDVPIFLAFVFAILLVLMASVPLLLQRL